MDLNELLILINKKFRCNYWNNHNKYRLYFDHTSKVVTFLELTLIDNNVISAIPKCIYQGKPPTSRKWIENYTLSASEYINTIAYEVLLLIKPFNQ